MSIPPRVDADLLIMANSMGKSNSLNIDFQTVNVNSDELFSLFYIYIHYTRVAHNINQEISISQNSSSTN